MTVFLNFYLIKLDQKELKSFHIVLKKKADIFLSKTIKKKNYYKLKVIVKKNAFYFKTKYSTNNFIDNILACISTLYELNLDLSKMEKKFINFSIPEGRGDIKIVNKFQKIFKFIDESYNANPLSMLSAINNMRNFKLYL